MDSQRLDELMAAFRRTDYWVEPFEGVRFDLHVGAAHSDLDLLLKEEGVTEWAFVTAYNPNSIQRGDDINRADQAKLEAEVTSRGLRFWHAVGTAQEGHDWPPEVSAFILRISPAEAAALGARFGQVAILVGRIGERAELILCQE